jgi:GNAT superfamily N-acetyltransferase
MEPEFSVVADPEPGLREAIWSRLLAFNSERVGPSVWTALAIPIREPGTGAPCGGLWAGSIYDWLYVDLLFVPEALRGRGIGSRLMRMAEDAARARGCVGVWVDTFLARGFYEKLGYEVFGTLPDNPRGSQRFFLCRRFDDEAPSGGGAGRPGDRAAAPTPR